MQKANAHIKQKKGPVFSIPDNLLQAFTMNGFARIKFDWYYSDTSAKVLNWTDGFYTDLKKTVSKAVKNGGDIYYSTDHLLPKVFQKYPLISKTVAVIGSATPLYEAYIDYFGGKPFTIEYRKINHNTDLKTYTFNEAIKKINKGTLRSDYALCYSSIEHSGLGRYGDYIDPEGDLFTMKVIKKLVKPGGLLFLQIPIGSDLLLWNNTRIYGAFRLLLLLEGWRLIDSFGYSPELLDQSGDHITESIFVLRNSDQKNSQKQLYSNKTIENFRALEEHRSRWQKKIKQLSAKFNYITTKDNARIDCTSTRKLSFNKILRKIIDLSTI